MNSQSLKILLVEDKSADAELIEELLSEVNEAKFDLTPVKRLSEGLGCLCQEDFDIVLLDRFLPDSSGTDTVAEVKALAPTIPIVVLTSLDDETAAIESMRQGAQDYLVKGGFKGELLVRAMRNAIERQRLEQALWQQAQRERLLRRMLEHIRQSLELGEILQTTVAEVRQFLQADRVLIYRCNLQEQWQIVGQAVATDTLTTPDLEYYPILTVSYLLREDLKFIQVVEDVETAKLESPYKSLLKDCQIRSVLTVPIIESGQAIDKTKSPPTNQLWGLLMAHSCSKPRQWQEWEVDFLKHLAAQVAVAIQQSQLYQQLETANQELFRLASSDYLTGIANRRRFDQVLDHEWRRLSREQAPLSLILCDLDFFKVYNDTYGHPKGDYCLQQIALIIAKAAKRHTDLVARYGGEEFAVILPNTDQKGAFIVAQEILTKVRAAKLAHANSPLKPYVTLSLGVVSTIPCHHHSTKTFIKAVDQALYQAKEQGRDRIVQGKYQPDSLLKLS
ncbi:MAG: diguanylate cyclase [Coleofasciculaceae cyanobacterium]